MAEGTHKYRTPLPAMKRDVVHVVKVYYQGLTVTFHLSSHIRSIAGAIRYTVDIWLLWFVLVGQQSEPQSR